MTEQTTERRRTLMLGSTDPQVRDLKDILRRHGYAPSNSEHLDEKTMAQLEVFKLQHIGPGGEFLECSPVVDQATWWALEHASGPEQRSGIPTKFAIGVTPGRRVLIDDLNKEHADGIREIPDGSNDSKRIREYFGPTGIRFQPWCCAFVSFFLNQHQRKVGGKWHLGVQRMFHHAEDLKLTTDQPKPGDVFVQVKAHGKGHTGFIVGVSPDNSCIYTIEGNCANRVKSGRRKMSSIDAIIDALQDGQGLDFERRTDSLPDLGGSGDR